MRRVVMVGILALGIGLGSVAGGCGGDTGGADSGADEGSDADEGPGDLPVDVEDSGPATQEALYDETGIPVVELRFTAAAWMAFLEAWTDKAKVDVPCDVGFRGVWFQGAACRPKGNEGDWDNEMRPQFQITINATDKRARFLGLRRLSLESNREHAAPIRDRLAMGMMRQAGIKAPRVNHVRVNLNGTYYGLYQNVEYVNQEFVAAHYEEGGNLYEKGTDLRTNEDKPDPSDIEALNALLESGPLSALAIMVDMPQVIQVMAAETVLPSYDNFSNGSWNYWWYHPPKKRFVLIPWDLDDCLSRLAPPDADPFTFLGHATSPSKLREWINSDPEWRKKFVDELAAIRDGAYAGLAQRTAEVCAQIRDAFAADPTKNATIEEFDADCLDVARRVEARRVFLTESLQ